MWIVRLALRRPYTFLVAAILIVLMGTAAALRMPADIFPVINIPVVTVIWTYNGMSPQEMERRVVTVTERSFTTTVSDIEHIESQSVSGVAVIKVFFQPDANIAQAVAQIAATSATVTRILPPGITPPLIVRYNAADVPILQVGISSPSHSEQELYDLGTNFVRTQLSTVRGSAVPLPYGGKVRQIMVDIDPAALYANGLSATDVANAINAQNLILPAGTAKLGEREYTVRLNSSPDAIAALNDLPIRSVRGTLLYVRDVAQVHDGFAVQTNVVRFNGQRSTFLTVLKSGKASTLDVVKRVMEKLPSIQATMPDGVTLTPFGDQSVFVRASLVGVIREAIIAACLTAAMILLFLGTWRSTLIVAVSIPLSILCSIIALWALDQTLNVMTLGGLALAVGILVDDATVTIENIHRHMAMGKGIEESILDGAQQIAVPAFVATLSICIVFVPVFLLSGAAGYLFTPLALAVIFAMAASYLLSRTLVPTLAHKLLAKEAEQHANAGGHEVEFPGFIGRISGGFIRAFDRLQAAYSGALSAALASPRKVALVTGGGIALAAVAFPFLGRDFFPAVDSGQIRLHVRAPTGTRLEETERLFSQVERSARAALPAGSVAGLIDNIGLPPFVNLAYSDNASIGPSDGEILFSINKKSGLSGEEAKQRLRKALKAEYPDLTFFFQPSDITSQILNFGLPAPIDVQVVGPDRAGNNEAAQRIAKALAKVPGATDVHVHQVTDAPELMIAVDRERASGLGLTQRDVAGNVLVSLSSSTQTAPNYWINPQNGVNYPVAVQTPQRQVGSMEDLLETPVAVPGAREPQLLDNVAMVRRQTGLGVVNHYNVAPAYDVYAATDRRDLGAVSAELDRILASEKGNLPKGSTVVVRGQVQSMRDSFAGLGVGLIAAIVLVYLLMVVNFQSWTDPLIIIAALPGALIGIIWMLFTTQTTLSVPSLMGAIMAMGVATANSILVVSFARERMSQGASPLTAALEAGTTRLRPVMMTALAMIIGMVPMALALGEGGEQNAPLGRAVIGGLLVATFATLFLVPVIFSQLHGYLDRRAARSVA